MITIIYHEKNPNGDETIAKKSVEYATRVSAEMGTPKGYTAEESEFDGDTINVWCVKDTP